ncbi:MAG: hypothetical protein HQL28_02600 [Candidatus Omnitrophica bacterium]|nr:hypothetical protein [Candidatus Omnitrophota bacterium]
MLKRMIIALLVCAFTASVSYAEVQAPALPKAPEKAKAKTVVTVKKKAEKKVEKKVVKKTPAVVTEAVK